MIKHYRTLLLVFALFCNTVVIQAQNVSLKLNNVTVKEAIEAVKKQTGKSFFFNVNDVDLNHPNRRLEQSPLRCQHSWRLLYPRRHTGNRRLCGRTAH